MFISDGLFRISFFYIMPSKVYGIKISFSFSEALPLTDNLLVEYFWNQLFYDNFSSDNF